MEKIWMTLFGSLIISWSAQAMTLQDAMQTAFEKNPKTQANNLRLKAMEERTRAAWLAFLPQLQLSLDMNQRQSGFNQGRGWQSSSSNSAHLNVGLSFNIFDGGVRYYDAKSAEAGEKARSAQFNSTDSRIPNTRGAIAGQVFNAYTNILRIQEYTSFESSLRAALVKFFKIAQTSDEEKRIRGMIAAIDAKLSDLGYQIQEAARDFENVVKAPMPSQIDDYDQTIVNVLIPENGTAAIQIALKKSPELNVASYQLQRMKLDHRADRAGITRPQVNGYVSRSQGISTTDNNPANRLSEGTTVGMTVSWSFSAPRQAHARASSLEVEALQKEKDGVLDDLKFHIDSAYPKIENLVSNVNLYSDLLENGKQDLADVVERIDRGEQVNVENALAFVRALQGSFYPAVMAKQELLTAKFQLQKTIGTLFDEVKLKHSLR